jgi:hypothetical protein
MFAARRLMNVSVVRGAGKGAAAGLCRAAAVRNFSERRQVTIETAKAMPKLYYEMPNDVLLTMAVMGDQEAREERLIREIMAVDNVDW